MILQQFGVLRSLFLKQILTLKCVPAPKFREHLIFGNGTAPKNQVCLVWTRWIGARMFRKRGYWSSSRVVGHGPAKDRAEESRVGRGQGPAASWHALHTHNCTHHSIYGIPHTPKDLHKCVNSNYNWHKKINILWKSKPTSRVTKSSSSRKCRLVSEIWLCVRDVLKKHGSF